MRTRIGLCLFVCLWFQSVAAWAVTFVLNGNSSIPDNLLLEQVQRAGCIKADSACIDSVCNVLARYYWESGHLSASISCRPGAVSSDTVRVRIVEGPISQLKSVRFTGASVFKPRDLEAAFAGQIGKPLSRDKIELAISHILHLYDAEGYPLTGIQPDLIGADEGWVNLTLRIDEGPPAIVGGVTFDGALKTKPNVLLRESGLGVGRPYDGRHLERARQRLVSLGVFRSVSEAGLSFDPGDTTVWITFGVEEARTNAVEGLAGYSPSGPDKFVGSLNLEFANLGGTLRRLEVLWTKPGGGRLAWSIYYREPRVMGLPFALESKLTSDVIDTLFARRRFWAGLAFRGEANMELGVGGSAGATKDRRPGAGEGDFTERGFSFALRYDVRDDPVNPRQGYRVSLSHEVSRLDFDTGASKDRTLNDIGADAEYLAALGEHWAFEVGARFQGVYSSQPPVPVSHLLPLGGMRSLRGYPEEWFRVEQALVGTFEIRRLAGEYSRVYLFFDAASIEDQHHTFGQVRSAPFGYGIGLMGGSRSGVVRLEIALGRDDSWPDAKLHLGLVQRF